MTQHTRPNHTGILPRVANAYEPNWIKIKRQAQLDTPSVTTYSNTVSCPAGAPGGFAALIFNPVAKYPLNDRYNMVGQTTTASIRFPWDGIYDIFGIFMSDAASQVFELQAELNFGTTSDQGYVGFTSFAVTTPSGGAYLAYIQNNLAAPVMVPTCFFNFTGLEFHANDVMGMSARVSAAGAQFCHIDAITVRWVAPIPNNTINIGTKQP